MPSDMDGQVLMPIAQVGGVHDHPVLTEGPARWWPDEQTARASSRDSVDDEEAVRERLRALGYFE